MRTLLWLAVLFGSLTTPWGGVLGDQVCIFLTYQSKYTIGQPLVVEAFVLDGGELGSKKVGDMVTEEWYWRIYDTTHDLPVEFDIVVKLSPIAECKAPMWAELPLLVERMKLPRRMNAIGRAYCTYGIGPGKYGLSVDWRASEGKDWQSALGFEWKKNRQISLSTTRTIEMESAADRKAAMGVCLGLGDAYLSAGDFSTAEKYAKMRLWLDEDRTLMSGRLGAMLILEQCYVKTGKFEECLKLAIVRWEYGPVPGTFPSSVWLGLLEICESVPLERALKIVPLALDEFPVYCGSAALTGRGERVLRELYADYEKRKKDGN